MRENICTLCHVSNLARTESFWVFSPGFSSLINNISIGHGLPSVFQLQNVYARQCVGASVGFVLDIICVAQITWKFIHHALIVYNWGLFLSRGEDLADLLRLKDTLHTAAEPTVRSAVKILVSQRNDAIKAFFFAANKKKQCTSSFGLY